MVFFLAILKANSPRDPLQPLDYFDFNNNLLSDIAEHDDSKDDQSELVPGLSGDTIIVRVPSLGGEQTQNEFENINFTSEA